MDELKAAPPEQPMPEVIESGTSADELKAMLASLAESIGEVKTTIDGIASTVKEQ